jgi:hypothetical protein
MDRLKLGFDDRKIQAGLTDLAQRERIVWHASGMPDQGCSTVSDCQAAPHLPSLSPLYSAHHHIDLTPTTLRAHQPTAPVKHGRIGAVTLCHVGGIGLDLTTATLAPHD